MITLSGIAVSPGKGVPNSKLFFFLFFKNLFKYALRVFFKGTLFGCELTVLFFATWV